MQAYTSLYKQIKASRDRDRSVPKNKQGSMKTKLRAKETMQVDLRLPFTFFSTTPGLMMIPD